MTEPAAPVVVGVDGSDTGDRALDWAIAESALWDAPLDAIHVWHLPIVAPRIGAPPPLWDAAPFEAGAKEVLDRVVTDGLARTAVPPRTVHRTLMEGGTAAALLERATGARMLVVGSRGRGGFTGLLLGSVSSQCLHHARCPVVVVPPSWRADAGDGRVVVGVDGSANSAVALSWAAAEAVRRSTRLVVAHAWYTPYPVAPYGVVLAPIDERTFAATASHLLRDMTSDALGHAGPAPPSVELVPVQDSAPSALVAIARGADLLVVGSRGHGGFRGLLLGSVSQQCVHHAACPVAVVPPCAAGS